MPFVRPDASSPEAADVAPSYRERVTELAIRPADPDDAAALAAIYAHWVEHSVVTFDTEAPGVADWTERLDAAAEAGHPVLVGVEDGVVVGYASVSAWKPKLAYRWTVEDSVYVAPTALGGGRGRALLTALIPATRDSGFRRIVALVADAGSPASVTLHEELGFVSVGRMSQIGWKHDRWVDVDLLQLDLTGR